MLRPVLTYQINSVNVQCLYLQIKLIAWTIIHIDGFHSVQTFESSIALTLKNLVEINTQLAGTHDNYTTENSCIANAT